jgi:hypothetical protein
MYGKCKLFNMLIIGSSVDEFQAARSSVICVLDAVSELAIIAAPILLLSKLQMQQAKKRAVHVVFAIRLG